MMSIDTQYFVKLEDHNPICGEDRCFIRCSDGSWFETNGFLGDHYEPISRNGDDRELVLMLEAEFWKTMYRHKEV